MKFLTKINRNYFILLTITLLVVTVSAFFTLNKILLHNTKQHLIEQTSLIKKQIAERSELPNIYPIIEVKKDTQNSFVEPSFKRILIKNEKEDEMEEFLEYSNQIKVKANFYTVKLRESTFESEDLVAILTGSLSILLLSVLIITFFISKKFNKTVWKDFEKNLQKIEQFSFTANKPLSLLKSDIEEFDRLNKVVDNLTEKLGADYLSLKEFSENASHEIQTPLSIVLLNLEEVLQQDLNEETFKKVLTSIHALKRLSTLNQSLILLTKIENKQFIADRTINFNELIVRKTEEFSSLFETKNIKVELELSNDFVVKINEQLAEILVNNLLSNAIKHNINQGEILISLTENEFKICNTGEQNSLTDDTIFNRFTKGNSKSYGLGLAIVKNICETNLLQIHYSKNEFNCFSITHKIENKG
ncbi:MAG: HAMP domain-containing sensor histidine kinase [Paludibacter sp.]|nr:HAMP domain-containing sensor histidine kinase [Paludibacter sp.]